jgi:hypothetical protein
MWSARAHEAKRMCLGARHILTNGGECSGWNLMTPKCTPTLKVALVQEARMFKVMVGNAKKHQIGPLKYNSKGLEV